MRIDRGFLALVCAATLLVSAPASAQQRPLLTQDPECVGAGRVLVEAGFDYSWGQQFTASGLEGDLLRAPLVGVSVGLGAIAELQIDGGFRHLAITDRQPAPLAGLLDIDGNGTSAVEDIVVATKVRLLSETTGRPGLGVRFATRLPNASNESGLGLDTTDFFASLLVGKTVESIRVVGNVGLGILADPTEATAQNDVLTYGLSLARALTDRTEVVVEVNGRVSTRSGEAPPGTESRGVGQVGLRYGIGAGRLDAGVIFGLTTRDAGVGVTAGYTYVFARRAP